jgi:hypothetical protein
MRIHEFVWPQDRIDHIDRHGVTPEEVEEACFGHALVQRAKSEGENPVYYVLDRRTLAGICSVWSFGFRMGRAIQSRLGK